MDDSVSDVDESLLRYIASLSYEQRLRNNQEALDLVTQLLKAHEELYGKPKQSPPAPTPSEN